MKQNILPMEQVSWEEIEVLITDDKYKPSLQKVGPSIYNMVLEERNRPKVIESVLKMLRDKEPENATEEYAEKIVDLMQEVARKVLKERSK